MFNLVCKFIGHNWKTYHRKTRNGKQLFRNCRRCHKRLSGGIVIEYTRKEETNEEA